MHLIFVPLEKHSLADILYDVSSRYFIRFPPNYQIHKAMCLDLQIRPQSIYCNLAGAWLNNLFSRHGLRIISASLLLV